MDECHNGELRHLVCGTDEVQEGFSLGVLFDQRERDYCSDRVLAVIQSCGEGA